MTAACAQSTWLGRGKYSHFLPDRFSRTLSTYLSVSDHVFSFNVKTDKNFFDYLVKYTFVFSGMVGKIHFWYNLQAKQRSKF